MEDNNINIEIEFVAMKKEYLKATKKVEAIENKTSMDMNIILHTDFGVTFQMDKSLLKKFKKMLGQNKDIKITEIY